MPAKRKVTMAAGLIERVRAVPARRARRARRCREVLIAKRFASLTYGGLWEFPAGRVQPGESPEAALRRIAESKLGVKLAIEIGQPPFVQQRSRQIITFRYFLCHITAGQARPIRYTEVRWVEPGQLCEYHFEPAARQVAEWLARG